MWIKEMTLSTRLMALLVSITSVLFLLFTAVMMIIVFSFEDAVFNRQLLSAERSADRGLPTSLIEHYTFENLPFNNQLIDRQSRIGELADRGRHFHYRKVSSGYFVVDVTDQMVVKRGLSDIILILFPMLLMLFAASFFLARWLTHLALKPFQQLLMSLQSDAADTRQIALLMAIRERDIRLLATRFYAIMDEKQQLIEAQRTFNQGVSHELRSPLQVIRSSVELLAEDDTTLVEKPAFQRLAYAQKKMQRISIAFLWLTTQETCQETLGVSLCVKTILNELASTLETQNLAIEVDVVEEMRVKLPVAVCELIITHLILNAAKHAEGQTLVITIRKNKLSFENGIEPESQKLWGFNLGLTLVQRLAERFDLTFSTLANESTFFTSVECALEEPNAPLV